jgi:PKD repeat protein
MHSHFTQALRLLALGAILLIGSCTSGGDDGTTPPIGEPFSLIVTANPESGPAPLLVQFFVVPSGGVAPYTYSWDFDNDGVPDSNLNTGVHSYATTSQAKVTVTDNRGQSVTASRTITVTPPGSGGGGGVDEPLSVRFNATPQFGYVPFDVQFQSVVTGGRLPYQYAWDFDGDGTFDSFEKDPLFSYTEAGQPIGGNQYLHFPVLRVIDGRGVPVTNLDDLNGDGNPDFRIAINALPTEGQFIATANADPRSGQAPLTVEFTGSVSGASSINNVEFRWDFGDGTTTSFSDTSIASHTYEAQGEYSAVVTARDKTTGLTAVSSPIQIEAASAQTFAVTIDTDVTSGQVPFLVNFEANTINGSEPISYRWDVFDDDPNNPIPDLSNPPGLTGAAVVTPDTTSRKSPTIHFGNTAGTNGTFNYIARCVAIDASGNTSVSNLIRITAQPRVNPPAQTPGYYEAHRPLVTHQTVFPAFSDPTGSANPVAQALPAPQNWNPRANAAMVSHPTGVSFIIGGEIIDENGNFQSLVSRGDSNYAYMPRPAASGSGQAAVGKYTAAMAGNLIRLNDGFGPAYPNSEGDSPPPPVKDPQNPPAQPPPTGTLRSAPFTIVGSAGAVFIHETPETNPVGQYPPRGTTPAPGSDDPTIGLPSPLYGYPDASNFGWDIGVPGGNPPDDGLGSPVIYVLGGRTAADSPVNLIQKYYVWGFGTENLPAYSQDFSFQSTGNQVDIWSPHFLRPDTDQYPGSGTNFDPQVQARQPGGTQNGELPTLPVPLYGLMAARLESGVDSPSPAFPNGPFRNIYIFGGIDDAGAVRSDARYWNTSLAVENEEDLETDGLFNLLEPMPNPRAYGKAVVIPSSPPRIALIGGFDDQNQALDIVDIFVFDNQFGPATGTWSSFAGTLPEALRAAGGGYNPGVPGQDWVLAFGGFTTDDFSHSIFNARLGSPGSLVVTEGLPVAPRSNLASSQPGAPVPFNVPGNFIDFNRYYLAGGVSETGVENIMEVVSLP